MIDWRHGSLLLCCMVLSLGCAGLFEDKAPVEVEPLQDTSEEQYEDTAERKKAKAQRQRKKKLAAMPQRPTTGSLTIKVAPGSEYTAAEVSCTATDFRKRCNFSNNTCVMPGVPLDRGVGCRAFFQGGNRASWGPVAGGSTLSCSFSGQRANCTEG